MTAYKSTNKNLTEIEVDILKQCKTSAWFKHANREVVAQFYIANTMALGNMKERIDALNITFLKTNEAGEIVMGESENGKQNKLLFKSPEAETIYRAEMQVLGKQEITIFY